MEERGWLGSGWGVSEKGRKAKYYTLTRAGQAALEREAGRWAAYVAAVARLTPEATR